MADDHRTGRVTDFRQTNRRLKISTPLGEDALVLESFQAREAASELFEFEFQTFRPVAEPLARFDELLGKEVLAQVSIGREPRYFGGIVVKLTQCDTDARQFLCYKLTVAPKLWRLTRNVRCRIFQDQTVPGILRKLLTDAGISADWKISGSYLNRPYCVQYNESDFQFFSRLAESQGIWYYFTHGKSGHKLVLCDATQANAELPYGSKVACSRETLLDREYQINSWNKSQQIRAGEVAVWDENFEVFGNHLDAVEKTQASITSGKVVHPVSSVADGLSLYEYPGGHGRAEVGDVFSEKRRIAKIRMQQETARAVDITGKSFHAALTPGHWFTLEDAGSDNGKYLVTAVQHTARQPIEAREDAPLFEYSNDFTCVPFDMPYRPERRTAAPSVLGVQLATVTTCGSTDDILTDKYGRVKVVFHWDRSSDASCWLRVATPWAGKTWGMIHIPRDGQEVIVDFEQGDVDRPIIVGSVYNATNMPPYALPAKKTQSGIKSRSTPSGAASEFNELRFEDKKGAEQIYIHAQKDMVTDVLHDVTKTVQNSETITIKDSDQKLTLEKGNRFVTLSRGNQTTTLDTGNVNTKVKTGDITTKVDLGKTSEEAMQSIELKVGQSSIKLDQSGVTIKGLTIKVEAQIQTEMKSVITQIDASAMLVAKGGVVMIN